MAKVLMVTLQFNDIEQTDYPFNHKTLAKVFRAKTLDAIVQAGLTLPLIYPDTWVVDVKLVR